MRLRIARLAAWAGGTVLAVVLAAVAVVYAGSEWMLRRRHDTPLPRIAVASSVEDLAEGERLAIIVGCWEGCHGRKGEGGDEEAPGVFRATAPTLSDVLPAYTDPELVRLVRFGVKRDGRTAIGMPSGTFYPLSDADLGRIIAHLRRQPALPPVPRERVITALGRFALVTGQWKTSAGQVDPSAPRWGELPRTTPAERGRYLASITCTECHGPDLEGLEYLGSPTLMVAAGYPSDGFRHLLRTGEPLSGRDLGLMSRVSRAAFRLFTDQEIDDLHAYLKARFALPANQANGSQN